MAKLLVRIKPSNQREVHVTHGVMFRKEKGWYEVDEALARELAKEVMSDRNPESPKVFDVTTAEDAALLVRSEQKRVDPAGTVDAPKTITPMPNASADDLQRVARERTLLAHEVDSLGRENSALRDANAELMARLERLERLQAAQPAAEPAPAKVEPVAEVTSEPAATQAAAPVADVPPPPAPPAKGSKKS